MGYGQYERHTRRRRNNTSLTVTIIALVVCLVLALTGFALSLTGAKRAAQELNDKNAQQHPAQRQQQNDMYPQHPAGQRISHTHRRKRAPR